MGKSKGARQNAGAVSKQQLHGIKNGSVKKNKDSKFKNTPMGKVTLINNTKAQNKNSPPQKNIQKSAGAKNNQNSSKGKAQQSKQNLPKGKQNFPTGQIIAAKKMTLNPKKKLEEVDDSDSDIDEGIVPQEDISLNKSDETFEDEEESDSDIPDILGKSLKDESDEDDEDFEDEEEDDVDMEEETFEYKGVKMFKGLNPKTGEKDDDGDEDEDSDENPDFNQSSNMESDEDDDEEDDEDDEEDDDDEDDDDDMDDEEFKKMSSSKLDSLLESDEDDENNDEDEDEDEDEDGDGDEDEEEEEEEEEDEDSAPGLKALLGSNIADDDDDEDFNEEDEDDEDDDISDEDEDGEENDAVKVIKEKAKTSKGNKQPKEQEKRLSPEEKEEINKKTVIIDNIPKEAKEEDIRKVFGQFGPINDIRISNGKMSKKMFAVSKRIPLKTSTTAIVFVCYKSQDSAQKALKMNGKQFSGNYMNVISAAKSERKSRDNKKAVFLGNLKYGMENNTLWKHFGKCGEIENVQILRNNAGMTRGCGYINFKTKEAAMLALKLDGDIIMDRPVRVKPCFVTDETRKNQGQGNKRTLTDKGHGNPQKKLKNISEKPVARKPENEMKQQKKQKNYASPEERKLNSFQGQKANVKNKKKGNKPDKKKKEMAKKLTAKPNKSVKV